jgi:hypothetical protein
VTENIRTVVQPEEFFKMMKIKNLEEASTITSVIFSLIAYLKVGEELKTSSITLTKISPDLIFVDSNVDKTKLIDELSISKTIKIPV